MGSYIFKVKKDITGRTHLKLKNVNNLEKKDIVYICDYEDNVKSRWIVNRVKDNIMSLCKEPFTSINVPFSRVFNEKYEGKVCKLTNEDNENISHYFIHATNIYPCYDYESTDELLNSILNQIRHDDCDVEIYADTYTDNTNINYLHCFKDKYNLVISKNNGVIVFKTILYEQLQDNEFFNEFLEDLGSRDEIFNSLLGSSLLTEDGEKLNIPYRRFYVSQNELDDEFYVSMNKSLRNKGIDSITMIKMEDLINIITKEEDNVVIDESKHYGIMQMLMPQYVTSRAVNISRGELKFINSDCYELDENQKTILESLNERTYIKASAGAGKTIILLAKAYNMATNNPDKQFLIICYNNKLAEDISRLAINTGKLRSNLRIYTLDNFILEERISTYESPNASDKFRIIKQQFVEAVNSGRYKKKYGGIFVDEMQQLNDEWKLALLNCCDENHYMIMAGDYFQQIRQEDKSEENDVEFIDDEDNTTDYMLGDYAFKQMVLDINYRNTKEISAVINKLVKKIDYYREKLEIPIKKEEKAIVYGTALKNSDIKPKYLTVTTKELEASCIKANIKYLIEEKGYIQKDILLLSPFGYIDKWPWLFHLEQDLKNQGLQVCDFTQKTKNSLADEGVRFGTIGKAIGLDFKAVIIFGLDQLIKTRDEDGFKFYKLSDIMEQDISTKTIFIKYLKNLYVACSRARETLIVIDNNKQENLISEFIKIVGEEDG